MAAQRSWLLYAAAWLPLYAIYALAISAVGEPFGAALWFSFYNVAPLAGFGVPVLQLSARLPCPQGRQRTGFLATHAVAALAYAVACTGVTSGLFLLHQKIVLGSVSLQPLLSPLLFWQGLFGLLFYAVLARDSYAVVLRERLREEERRAAQAEALRSRAELQVLRAQLNPHFLFNTLHSVLALVRRDPQAAEDALERFGDLLRYPLRVHEEEFEEVDLRSEWTFSMDYLELESLRLGERLRVTTQADDAALACRVPTFCLQPLVENAVGHAVAPRRSGGRVSISASVEDGTLELCVLDDGPGASAEEIAAAKGLGLSLLRQRLSALYGRAASLEAGQIPGGGLRVSVRLPAFEETA